MKSERKFYQQKLSETEEQYQMLLDNMIDGVYILNEKGYFTYINSIIEKRSGMTIEQFKTLHFLDIIKPQYHATVLTNFEKIMNGKEAPPYELEYTNADGKSIYVEVNTKPIYKNGKIVGLQGISRHITERKQTEVALRRSEERYRSIFESTREGIITANAEGIITSVNPAALEIFGYDKPEDLLGKQASRGYAIPEQRIELFKELNEKGYVKKKELTFVKKDGSFVNIFGSATMHKDKDGNVERVETIFSDITELKKAQQELYEHRNHLKKLVDEQTQELKKTNIMFKQEIEERKRVEEALKIKDAAIESSINAIALVDLRGYFTYVNPSFRKLTGYENNEVIGKLATSFWENLGIDIDPVEMLKRKKHWMGESLFRKKNGTHLEVHLSANIVENEDSKPKCILISFIDNTPLKLLQNQLIRSERLAATGQLAVSIAHEINSPLQAITYLLTMLQIRYKDDHELIAKINLLKNAYFNIRDTVKKLLNLNRPGKEQKQLININLVIEDTVSLLTSLVTNHKIKIRMQLSPKIPNITASPQQLSQVFLNLINNSIEALNSVKEAKQQKEIFIKTSLVDNLIHIHFSDNGPGILPQDLQHVFNPFYTKKRMIGVGIGLSVCHGIINDHSGTIEVDNLPTCGAVFTITLPVIKKL